MTDAIKDAIRSMAELSMIGLQAIEMQRARQHWIDAKRIHRKTFLEYVDGMDGAYRPGDDENVDATYKARRAAANASRSEAAKLRRMIRRYEATKEQS
jgi:hypothetical protein